MIRVLIADDSATARQLLRAILEEDPEIAVVGEAKNGEEAVSLVGQLGPDIVIMDVHMPIYDGIQATREIMQRAPTPILIVSAVTARDVDLSLSATEAGALMALVKPAGPLSPNAEESAEELRSMTRAMAHVKVVRRWRGPAPSATRPAPPTADIARRPIDLVAVAASTGGPAALRQIVSVLPANFPVPVVLVQHIAHEFASGFADWLGSEAAVVVKLAIDRESMHPGHLYVAPDGKHLGVGPGGRIQLSGVPPISGFRPSATYLFESASREYGSRLLGTILTGMGSDGAAGLKAAHDRGSLVIAQDQGSSVVYGMAQEAVRAGAVDMVLPLDRIGPRWIELVATRETNG